jgi:uncharacterized repeat protein (TIGR03847 family)
MPNDINFDPADFITVGTIGEKGNRTFHLQAKQNDTLVTFVMEKQQAAALAEGIEELLTEVAEQFDRETPKTRYDVEKMELEEPILPAFRIAEMRLAYDSTTDRVQILVNELLMDDSASQREARLSGSREQMRKLATHTQEVVSQGRAKPEQNGYRMHY